MADEAKLSTGGVKMPASVGMFAAGAVLSVMAPAPRPSRGLEHRAQPVQVPAQAVAEPPHQDRSQDPGDGVRLELDVVGDNEEPGVLVGTTLRRPRTTPLVPSPAKR